MPEYGAGAAGAAGSAGSASAPNSGGSAAYAPGSGGSAAYAPGSGGSAAVEPGVLLRDVPLPRLSAILNRFFFVTLAGGFLVGVLSVIAGGCVMRQHVLCAQGDGNALFYLAGFYGAVIVYYALLARFFGWVYA
jgi:uncharacterized membrane protein YedE/YeeE